MVRECRLLDNRPGTGRSHVLKQVELQKCRQSWHRVGSSIMEDNPQVGVAAELLNTPSPSPMDIIIIII